MKINGVMMKKVTIKTYAVKHKLSIFNVMKMVKSQKLKSVVEEENGKEVTYILLDDAIEEEVKNSIVPFNNDKDMTLSEEVNELREEVSKLKNEIEMLKKAIL